jgi:hypothetical protein
MKTNRQRHDPQTAELFRDEETLRTAFPAENWTAVQAVLDKWRQELSEQKDAGIASSRGLDHFLQVAMAWITTYLGRRAGSDSFRSTVSLFLPSLQAVLVKPSVVAPHKARAPQPTISTDPGNPNFGYRGAIGHTGVVMVSNEILYCQPVATKCAQYIELEAGRSQAALCIPLKGIYTDLALDFKKKIPAAGNTTCSLNGHCKPFSDRISSLNEDRIVLNIECISDYLNAPNAVALLDNPEFADVVQVIIDTVTDYQKQRDTHRALEHSSTLLALATNTLRPRDSYRALLREISTACDGADVTLHLRDLFDKENEHRCSLFVTGIGKNFRDFLINERIGLPSGQIGLALSDSSDYPADMTASTFELNLNSDAQGQSVKVRYVAGDEITKSLTGANEIPFKQLMPNTFLNVTVPIYFDDIKMGVLNLEWDQKTLEIDAGLGRLSPTLDADSRQAIENYLSECLPVVYRMADYFSLVIDYFDDVQNLIGRPKEEELNSPDFIDRLEREGALRKVMRYYMKRGMTKAEELAKEVNSSSDASDPDKEFRAEASCLQDLVDAMGYFLAHISDLRILVSVRRKALDEKNRWILRYQTSHWLEGDKENQEYKESPIEIDHQESVLAACARWGIPLFGTIENILVDGKPVLMKNGIPKRQLRLDERFTNGDSRFPQLPQQTVPYRPAGRAPRYEVGVPLIFGGNLLGTFDFEQFEREKSTGDPKPLRKHDLCAHLEWSRAITFLLAYINDAISPISQTESRLKAFRRFQALTAQLIAEVPVDQEQFVAIATDSFAEIFPVKAAEVRKLKKKSDEQKEGHSDDADAARSLAPAGAASHLDLLRFRGVVENVLSWEETETAKRVLLRSRSEAKPRSTMSSMMTAYHSLVLNLREDPEEEAFKVAIDRTIVDLARAKDQLTNPARDAGEAILNLFLFLHKSLRRNLVGLAEEAEGGVKESEYAWFLHVRRFEPGQEFSSFGCEIEDTDKKKNVLAYCYTSEMKTIVERIQRQIKNSSRLELLKATESVLQKRSIKPVGELMRNVKAALPAEGPVGEQELIHALTVCLARNRVIKSGDPSLTLFVANAGGPLVVVPQINLSPLRSERGYGWFWELTYTVLGIPFMLNDQCVAVLNIFRRRDSTRDMRFFRIEERDKATELVSSVNEIVNEIVDVQRIKPIRRDELAQKLQPLVDDLVAKAERSTAKLIVVQSPFATSDDSFNDLWDIVFSSQNTPALLENAVRFPDDDTSIQKRNVVIRFGKRIDDYERLGADLRLLVEKANRVFLFTARREDLLQSASEPVYAPHVPIGVVDATLLRDDARQEEAYRKWLLGKAIVSTVGDRVKMLFRRDDAKQEWTYRAFTQWLRDRRRDSETADYYYLTELLQSSSWRPDKKTLALSRWGKQTDTEGAPH